MTFNELISQILTDSDYDFDRLESKVQIKGVIKDGAPALELEFFLFRGAPSVADASTNSAYDFKIMLRHYFGVVIQTVEKDKPKTTHLSAADIVKIVNSPKFKHKEQLPKDILNENNEPDQNRIEALLRARLGQTEVLESDLKEKNDKAFDAFFYKEMKKEALTWLKSNTPITDLALIELIDIDKYLDSQYFKDVDRARLIKFLHPDRKTVNDPKQSAKATLLVLLLDKLVPFPEMQEIHRSYFRSIANSKGYQAFLRSGHSISDDPFTAYLTYGKYVGQIVDPVYSFYTRWSQYRPIYNKIIQGIAPNQRQGAAQNTRLALDRKKVTATLMRYQPPPVQQNVSRQKPDLTTHFAKPKGYTDKPPISVPSKDVTTPKTVDTELYSSELQQKNPIATNLASNKSTQPSSQQPVQLSAVHKGVIKRKLPNEWESYINRLNLSLEQNPAALEKKPTLLTDLKRLLGEAKTAEDVKKIIEEKLTEIQLFGSDSTKLASKPHLPETEEISNEQVNTLIDRIIEHQKNDLSDITKSLSFLKKPAKHAKIKNEYVQNLTQLKNSNSNANSKLESLAKETNSYLKVLVDRNSKRYLLGTLAFLKLDKVENTAAFPSVIQEALKELANPRARLQNLPVSNSQFKLQ